MATKAVKECAVNFFKGFLDQVVPTNRAIEHFNNRPINQRLAVTAGRLIDDHEKMLNKWREAGISGAISPLPVFLMAFDKGYTPTGLEKGKSIAMSNFIVSDNEGNFFKVRVSKHDQRVQIVLYAPEHDTAFSLADQFKLYCADYKNRHHFAWSAYNGKIYPFAMTLEDNQIFGTNSPIPEQDNLTVTVFDLTFNCNTPYFVGDEINKTPYLPTVRAVVIDVEAYKNRANLYHQVVRDPLFLWEENKESVGAEK